MFVVLSIVFYGFKTAMSARGAAKRTDRETPFEPMPAQASAASH
jgi:carbon starvation protein